MNFQILRYPMKYLSGYAIVLLLLLVAMTARADNAEYRIGTGDVLRITVYSQPDLTTEARVSETGSITFPLIGEVRLAGSTPAEAEADIGRRLVKGGLINEPHVNVNVVQYRSQQVAVLGRVNRPGKFSLEKPSRVTDVLAMAGGIAADGSDVITLTRTTQGKTERYEIDAVALFKVEGEQNNPLVQDGDIINVPRQPVFYIYGEVQRPGSFRLENDMSIVQALSQAGGLTPRGTQRGIKIMRRDEGGILQEIPAQLADTVQANDVIHVRESLF